MVLAPAFGARVVLLIAGLSIALASLISPPLVPVDVCESSLAEDVELSHILTNAQGFPVFAAAPDVGPTAFYSAYTYNGNGDDARIVLYPSVDHFLNRTATLFQRVHTANSYHQQMVSLATVPNAALPTVVATWNALAGQDGHQGGAYSRVFQYDGGSLVAVTDEMRLDNQTAGHQLHALALPLTDDLVLYMWSTAVTLKDVAIRIFNISSGTAHTERELLTGSGTQPHFHAARLSDGRIVACSYYEDETELRCRIFTVDVDSGVPLDAHAALVPHVRSEERNTPPKVIALQDGGFVVVMLETSTNLLYRRRYTSDLEPWTDSESIIPVPFNVTPTALTAGSSLPDGGYMVLFTGDSESGSHVFLRRFDEGDMPVGNTVIMSMLTHSNGTEDQGAFALIGDNLVVGGWRDLSERDGSGNGVYGNVYCMSPYAMERRGDNELLSCSFDTVRVDTYGRDFCSTGPNGMEIAPVELGTLPFHLSSRWKVDGDAAALYVSMNNEQSTPYIEISGTSASEVQTAVDGVDAMVFDLWMSIDSTVFNTSAGLQQERWILLSYKFSSDTPAYSRFTGWVVYVDQGGKLTIFYRPDHSGSAFRASSESAIQWPSGDTPSHIEIFVYSDREDPIGVVVNDKPVRMVVRFLIGGSSIFAPDMTAQSGNISLGDPGKTGHPCMSAEVESPGSVHISKAAYECVSIRRQTIRQGSELIELLGGSSVSHPQYLSSPDGSSVSYSYPGMLLGGSFVVETGPWNTTTSAINVDFLTLTGSLWFHAELGTSNLLSVNSYLDEVWGTAETVTVPLRDDQRYQIVFVVEEEAMRVRVVDLSSLDAVELVSQYRHGLTPMSDVESIRVHSDPSILVQHVYDIPPGRYGGTPVCSECTEYSECKMVCGVPTCVCLPPLLFNTTTGECGSPYESCSDVVGGSGFYYLDTDGDDTTPLVEAYCDMETDGGGWTLAFAVDVPSNETVDWLGDAFYETYFATEPWIKGTDTGLPLDVEYVNTTGIRLQSHDWRKLLTTDEYYELRQRVWKHNPDTYAHEEEFDVRFVFQYNGYVVQNVAPSTEEDRAWFLSERYVLHDSTEIVWDIEPNEKPAGKFWLPFSTSVSGSVVSACDGYSYATGPCSGETMIRFGNAGIIGSDADSNDPAVAWMPYASNSSEIDDVARVHQDPLAYGESGSPMAGRYYIRPLRRSDAELYPPSHCIGETLVTGNDTSVCSSCPAILAQGGALLHFDASRGVVRDASNSLVMQWLDSSGNDFHASATNISSTPMYVASDNMFGDQPVLQFTRQGWFKVDPAAADRMCEEHDLTMFIVGLSDSFSGPKQSNMILSIHTNASDNVFRVGINPTTGAYFTAYRGISDQESNESLALGQPFLISAYVAAGNESVLNSEVYANGSILTDIDTSLPALCVAASPEDAPYYVSIGQEYDPPEVSSDYYGGKLAELIIFPGYMTQTNREKIEGYLSAKYGRELLPDGHPYGSDSAIEAETFCS